MNPVMPADPLAVRVARRHRDAVLHQNVSTTKIRVEYWCSGRISAFDVKMALEPEVGYLRKLRFRPPDGLPTTVAWEGVKVDGEVVTGKIVLRTAIAEDGVTSWGEVMVDREP